MDPFKNQIDDRTSYKSLDEQFFEARLDRDKIDQGDWPSQIDRAAIDVCYDVALGTTDSAFDHGGTIGRNDFGSACGPHYVDGLQALAGAQSDLPRLIDDYDATDLGDLAFRLNELRVELEKLDLGDSDISDLNRTTEALVEKLITQGSSGDLARQPLQKPEAVTDLLYQLFSDPAVTTYADVLIDAITGETGTSIGNRSLLEQLDRPQMVTPLWDHQQEGIKEWVKADTQGYVDMATATGKTVLGLAAIAHKFGELHPADTDSIPSIENSGEGRDRILIVAGQDLLLKQWQSEFDEHLNIPRSRTVQSQTAEENVIELKWGDIEFRTAQELLNNEIQHTYDLVILDEAHRYSSGRRDSRGWRDLFEELIDATDSILAMSGSIDDEWLGDDSVKSALEANLEQCIEFTIEDARSQNVVADFRWDVCYAASDSGETVEGIASSTKPLATVYNSTEHKFEPHELTETLPDSVPAQFETLRDLRSFAHTKEGKQARDNNEAFDRFATAAFSRKPKRWQLSPPAETIGQLLKAHLPERKSIVLVQSYTQAEAVGEHLAERYGKDLITIPEQGTDAPYDSISEFKEATQGVLVGPGEVLGVGVDLPNADVAINLAKGGVNASLIQRIGRILRNPTGDKQAHFYQVVALASDPEARLPGEDGRRLLRRASEFRALGSRFREHPGFVVADSTASEIVRVLETHGSQAKIKDDRPTEEIVEDDVARRFLDEITSEIDSNVGEALSHPVLTTYWKPESLSPGTLPVRESVQQSDQDDQSASKPESKSDPETDSESSPEYLSEQESESQPASGNKTPDKPATVIVKTRDPAGEPISDASVAIENPSPIDETTTNTEGVAIFNLSVFTDDVCVFVSKEGYESYFTSISVTEGEQKVEAELARQTERDDVDNSPLTDRKESEAEDDFRSASREDVIAEIIAVSESVRTYPMRSDFIEESDLEISEVYNHFASWNDAYEAAIETKDAIEDNCENKDQPHTTDTESLEDTQPHEEDSKTDYSEPPSREDVIAELRKVSEKVQTYPMRSDFIKEAGLDIGTVYDHFESWNDAYEASEVDLDVQEVSEDSGQNGNELVEDFQSADARIDDAEATPGPTATHPSREEVLDEIRTIDAKTGSVPMRSDFIEQSAMDVAHVYEHFRSWSKAYRAAQSPTEEDVVEDISRLATEIDPTETSVESTSACEPSTEGVEKENPTGTPEPSENQLTNETDVAEARDRPTAPSDPESTEEVDLTKRDLVIELVSLTQELQRVPTESEINQFGKFKYRDYEAKFGGLYEAAQQAGIIEDSVTRTEFLDAEQSNVDGSEENDDVNEAPGTEDSGLGNQDEKLDASDPGWLGAVRQELAQYHRKTGDDVITIEQFYEFSEHRLSNRFPDNNNVRAKIRQLFQRLRDHGEVEFLDGKGEYRINISAETKQDRNNISDDNARQERKKPYPIELIIELQGLDEAVEGYPLTTEMRQKGEYEPEQYYAEFGSWEEALNAAGINKKKRLITEIQQVAQEIGREPTTTDMGKYSPYSTGTHSQYFGSWSKALKLANVAEVLESVESIDSEQPENNTTQENNAVSRPDKDTDIGTQPSEIDSADSEEDEQVDSSDLVESIMRDIENQFENK